MPEAPQWPTSRSTRAPAGVCSEKNARGLRIARRPGEFTIAFRWGARARSETSDQHPLVPVARQRCVGPAGAHPGDRVTASLYDGLSPPQLCYDCLSSSSRKHNYVRTCAMTTMR